MLTGFFFYYRRRDSALQQWTFAGVDTCASHPNLQENQTWPSRADDSAEEKELTRLRSHGGEIFDHRDKKTTRSWKCCKVPKVKLRPG